MGSLRAQILKITGKASILAPKTLLSDDVQGSIFQGPALLRLCKVAFVGYHNKTHRHGVVVASFDSGFSGIGG